MSQIEIEQLSMNNLQPGFTLPVLKNDVVTLEKLKGYAQASGDLNPIHTDEAVAKSVGLKGPIAHGMYVMGLLAKYALNISYKNFKVKSLKMRFVNQTFLTDSINCSGEVIKVDGSIVEIELYAKKQDDSIVGVGVLKIERIEVS